MCTQEEGEHLHVERIPSLQYLAHHDSSSTIEAEHRFRGKLHKWASWLSKLIVRCKPVFAEYTLVEQYDMHSLQNLNEVDTKTSLEPSTYDPNFIRHK